MMIKKNDTQIVSVSMYLIDHVKILMRSLLSMPRFAKQIIVILLDVSLCIFTTWISLCLRIGEIVNFTESELLAVLLSILLVIPLFKTFGLYKELFRYSGWPTMFVILKAVTVYGILYSSIILAIKIDGIPRTVGVIQPLLFLLSVGASRFIARYLLTGLNKDNTSTGTLPKALIYGAGSAGRQLVSALDNSHEMSVVGFLDDDIRLNGHVLNGKAIFSPDDLPIIIDLKGVTHVLLAIPSASRCRRNEIIKNISKYHVAVRTLPSVTDLAEGRVTISDLCDLDVDDLLGRDTVLPNHLLLSKISKSKIVLVTGAGGSIGSELCRQIIKFSPKIILLVEICEYFLYLINSELEIYNDKCNKTEIIPLLASVQDEERIREIIDIWKPDIIYHAAAYKHVPLVEQNIAEGVKNNVFGTLNIAKLAIEYSVHEFILISTDKAVRPTNVMGASKRLSEMCLQALFDKDKSKTKFSMVRFGNVLDSSGSVIPKFRKQIREGGPVTLTHSEITRYFMTIPEAAQLVIQAGAMSKGGDVFVLDMGEPVKIFDLAKKMIELSGLKLRDASNPDGDIEIVITGLRPGEKLYEELLLGDNPQPTLHSKIFKAQDPFINWCTLETNLNVLDILIKHNNVEVILAILRKLVPEFTPDLMLSDVIFTKQVRLIENI